MKFNATSYTLFLFVMIMFFPFLIYAAWTVANPPKPPQDDFLRKCAQWIYFNGFTLDHYETNRDNAMRRHVMKDHLASTPAAMYAFKIGGRKDIYKILPEAFCKSFDTDNDVQMEFKTLEDEFKNCENWITLYGFSENDLDHNFTYALNQDPMKMKYISIWAYSYWLFLWLYDGEYYFTPSELCAKMGKPVGEDTVVMPFSSEHMTKLSCKGWIKLYDYISIPSYNLNKALLLQMELSRYPIPIHYFPDNYAEELRNLWNSKEPIDHFTPMEYCKKYDGESDEPKYTLAYRGEV